MGMMPHPERATEPLMGSTDGLVDLPVAWLAPRRCAHERRHHSRPHRAASAHARRVPEDRRHPRPRAQLHRARHLQRDVERALLLQELAPASEEAAHARQAAWCRAPARTPASSISATATSIAFKIESHNHPSFIEPFQGAATGVGGILRDIFTMGARPIAVMDALRFGPLDDPETGARNRRILEGVVAGIAHYGNCFGVPTVGGEMRFRAMLQRQSAGQRLRAGRVSSKDEIFYAKAAGVGNPVIYVGAQTGRDGIHGASMASRRVHRGIQAEASQRAGGRSVHGEAAARSLPRSDADRRDRRHSGHGRRRAHLLHLRDGQPRRVRASRSTWTACRSAKPA